MGKDRLEDFHIFAFKSKSFDRGRYVPAIHAFAVIASRQKQKIHPIQTIAEILR